MKNVSILQKDITIFNVSALQKKNVKIPEGKLTELQKVTDKLTTIIDDTNIPLSVNDRSSRQKLRKDTVELNSTINQLDLINIYRIFHPTQQNTQTSQAHKGTFTKTDHKTHANKCKRIENHTKHALRPQWN